MADFLLNTIRQRKEAGAPQNPDPAGAKPDGLSLEGGTFCGLPSGVVIFVSARYAGALNMKGRSPVGPRPTHATASQMSRRMIMTRTMITRMAITTFKVPPRTSYLPQPFFDALGRIA